MYIKPEDEYTLAEIAKNNYAITTHIAEYRYRRVINLSSRKRMAQHRAKKFADEDYLRRVELPNYRSERYGSVPFVYALGSKAIPIVAEHLGIDSETLTAKLIPPDDRVLLENPTHALQITDYYLALARSCEERHVRLLSWEGDTPLSNTRFRVTIPTDDGRHEKATFRPDAVYELWCPNTKEEKPEVEAPARAILCLEHDRATEPISSKSRRTSWKRKIRCYQALKQSGQLSKLYGIETLFVTIVTTGGPGRIENIKAIAESITGPDSHAYWITSYDNVMSIRPGKKDPPAINLLYDPIWHVSGQDKLWAMLPL